MSRTEIMPPVELGQEREEGTSWERDRQAFWEMRDSLLSQYRGLYVAVYQGEVVGSDRDDLTLATRVYERYGYVPIYVQLVTAEPLPVRRVPSPRSPEIGTAIRTQRRRDLLSPLPPTCP